MVLNDVCAMFVLRVPCEGILDFVDFVFISVDHLAGQQAPHHNVCEK